MTRSGASGGSYTSTTGLNINASTGAINLAASTPGTYTVTYTLAAGCNATTTVTITTAAAITGTASLCAGSTTTLGHPVAGGTWESDNTAVATISSAGVVSGLLNGTTKVTYTTPAGCTANVVVTVNATPDAIAGASQICTGETSSMANTLVGGTWISGSTSIATVNSAGVVGGMAAGSTNITYTVGGCRSIKAITVNLSPAAITGNQAVCEGAVTTFVNTTAGGTWSSDDATVALVGSTGIVSGVSAGTANITYARLGCYKTRVVTVNPLPAAITGTTSICINSTTTLGNTLPGGTWTSSSTTIATVGSSGIVTGVGAGSANINYIVKGCSATTPVTINPMPGEIAGVPSVCAGAVTTLGNACVGGMWSSDNTSIAEVSSAGLVSGVSAGTTIITYTKLGCYKIKVVTVNAMPSAFEGGVSICRGSTTTLSNSLSGGTWTSSSVVATINAGGVVNGVNTGTSIISYNAAGCVRTTVLTVNAIPVISGTLSVCEGAMLTLTATPAAGAWSSDASAVATVSPEGVVTGIEAGTIVVTYTPSLGCTANATVTVNAIPSEIVGETSVCIGSSITLSNAMSGGTWISSLPTRATAAAATGIISGISAGSVNITYCKNGCRVTRLATVNLLPNEITGTAVVCEGAATTLGNTSVGGTWASNNEAVATVGQRV